MNCYQINLNETLKVTMLNYEHMKNTVWHITRLTDEHIIYIILSGCLHLSIDGQDKVFKEGDICFFPKGTYQKPYKKSECEFYYIHFKNDNVTKFDLADAEYCQMVKENKRQFLCCNIYNDEQYNFMSPIIRERLHLDSRYQLDEFLPDLNKNQISYEQNSPIKRQKISAFVAEFLYSLESYGFEEVIGGFGGESLKVYSTVKFLETYISNHYRRNITSDDIEREFSINYDYANRIFKRHYGMSIIKYRNNLRINTAKFLISTTDKNLDEIAYEVGFSDRYYFCRCFKAITGMAPSSYRKKEYSVIRVNED